MDEGPPVVGDGSAPTELRTFLIADIRGYTVYTREHGDEGAAELAGAFATTVREVVAGHGGYLLELRGDEALVVFVSARQALRAAVELQERFVASGLARPVGIGLDAGEAVPVEGGYRGGALNLAARLCSRAKGGEILASEAVIHLAAHVDGLAYVDPRTLRLKGYEDLIRAVEVVPADRAPRARLAGKVRRVRRSFAAHRRVASVTVGLVLILALIGVLLPTIFSGGGSALASLRSGMALIDTETGEVRGFVGHGAVDQPAEVVYAEGTFWVLNLNPISFVRIDPSGKILTQIASPFDDVGFFAVDGDTLWVTQYNGPGLSKIDIDLGREVDRFTLSEDPGARTTGVAVGAGSVWVGRPRRRRRDRARRHAAAGRPGERPGATAVPCSIRRVLGRVRRRADLDERERHQPDRSGDGRGRRSRRGLRSVRHGRRWLRKERRREQGRRVQDRHERHRRGLVSDRRGSEERLVQRGCALGQQPGCRNRHRHRRGDGGPARVSLRASAPGDRGFRRRADPAEPGEVLRGQDRGAHGRCGQAARPGLPAGVA